jgi:hypothetical protein
MSSKPAGLHRETLSKKKNKDLATQNSSPKVPLSWDELSHSIHMQDLWSL